MRASWAGHGASLNDVLGRVKEEILLEEGLFPSHMTGSSLSPPNPKRA